MRKRSYLLFSTLFLLVTLLSFQIIYADENTNYKELSSEEIDNIINSSDINYLKELEETEENIVNITTPSSLSKYSSYDYVIDEYNIDMIVNEDNSYEIKETITAYFNVSKHGIIRYIPLKNTITRLDSTTSTNTARISNLNVDNQYSTSYENQNYKIQIGSANKTVKGQQKYTINYTYTISGDNSKDYDELYFNLIGDKWDTAIGNITFKITMPKEFDESKIGFSYGTKASTTSKNVSYDVDGKTITGKYNGILNKYEALTIRIELPESYFIKNSIDKIKILFYTLLPIIGLIITFLIWNRFGKDDKYVETVEFYPPDGVNSLELAFLYKGSVNNQDVVSLLVYLANKGYIKIVETENKSFKIIKLREYDGYNEQERLFLEGLFKSKRKKTTYPEDEISATKEDLYNKFYRTANNIASQINTKENKNILFEKNSAAFFISLIITILSLVSLILVPSLNYGTTEEILMTLFLMLFYSPFYAVIFSSTISTGFRIIWGTFTFIHSAIFMMSMPFGSAITTDTSYLPGLIIGIICILLMMLLTSLMKKRTPYGVEILGRIQGFKHFLETAERDRLESLVMQDPKYFYNILPYTYVLGISKKWIDRFETLVSQPPDWYESPHHFDSHSFGQFMNSTITSATSSMTSSPSSSSSGSSSGGGSSGGGSGGGGGSSW